LLAELGTPRDREILTRVYLRDEDKDAICAALGVDATHFNRVLFRAKERFRELLIRADRRNKLRLVG
jgi:RNA polymerase sigma-70 factor (ECF subfamily)